MMFLWCLSNHRLSRLLNHEASLFFCSNTTKTDLFIPEGKDDRTEFMNTVRVVNGPEFPF